MCVGSSCSQRPGMNIHSPLNYTCLVLFRAWLSTFFCLCYSPLRYTFIGATYFISTISTAFHHSWQFSKFFRLSRPLKCSTDWLKNATEPEHFVHQGDQLFNFPQLFPVTANRDCITFLHIGYRLLQDNSQIITEYCYCPAFCV